jgi:hypothetical protein
VSLAMIAQMRQLLIAGVEAELQTTCALLRLEHPLPQLLPLWM